MADTVNSKLSKDDADALLKNVLDSCEIPYSQKSIDELMAESAVRRRPLMLHRMVTIVCLVAVILTPLAFRIDRTFRVTQSERNVTVTSHYLYDSCFVMTLAGNADYDNIYAKKDDGSLIYPEKTDSEAGLVVFPYDGEPLNIYIHSGNGGCIQAVLAENAK